MTAETNFPKVQMQPLVADLALRIWAQQRQFPKSPASVDGFGTVSLCGAACVAAAAIEIHQDRNSRDQFVHKLGETKAFSLVENAFLTSGMSPDDCRKILIFNDGFADQSSRNLGVGALLESHR